MRRFTDFAKLSGRLFTACFCIAALVSGCSKSETHKSETNTASDKNLNAVAAPSSAAITTAAGISIENGWVRAAGDGVKMSAGYLVLSNKGETADTLLGVSTPIAEFAEVHQSLEQDGMAMMRRIPALEIAPGESVTFENGSYHIMLINLTAPLAEGDMAEVTFTFEKAGNVTVPMAVRPATMIQDEHHGHH